MPKAVLWGRLRAGLSRAVFAPRFQWAWVSWGVQALLQGVRWRSWRMIHYLALCFLARLRGENVHRFLAPGPLNGDPGRVHGDSSAS